MMGMFMVWYILVYQDQDGNEREPVELLTRDSPCDHLNLQNLVDDVYTYHVLPDGRWFMISRIRWERRIWPNNSMQVPPQ